MLRMTILLVVVVMIGFIGGRWGVQAPSLKKADRLDCGKTEVIMLPIVKPRWIEPLPVSEPPVPPWRRPPEPDAHVREAKPEVVPVARQSLCRREYFMYQGAQHWRPRCG